MMRTAALSVGVVGLSVGCAGQPAAQAPLAPQTLAQTAPATDASREAQTFADPGVPAGVVVWLRAAAPARDLPILGTLTGLGGLLDPSDVLTRKLGARLGRAVDLSKPADFTAAGFEDGDAGGVLAAGIADVHRFMTEVEGEYAFAHVATGRWRLTPKKPAEGDHLHCEIWQALAPVGARLLCASEEPLLEAEGPFLLSAARTQVDHSNLHAEMSGAALALAVKKGSEADAAHEDSDERSGAAMGRQFVTDAVNDLRSLSWDVTLQHDSVELAQVIRFAKTEALFSVAVAGRSGAAQAVPAAFWSLPSDAELAFYSEGAEPERLRRLGVPIFDAFNRSALQEGDELVPPEVLSQIAQIEHGLFLRGGAWELAYGQDLTRASDALNAGAKALKGASSAAVDSALTKAQAALGGWAVLGLDDDDSHAFIAALRSGLAIARLSFPHRKSSKPSPPSSSRVFIAEIPISVASHLPTGSLHFAVSFKPNPKFVAPRDGAKPAPPTSVHFVLVPDTAQHVWVGIARDEATAIARVQGVLSPPAQQVMGADPELRALAQGPIAGLGYGTLAGITGLGLSAKSQPELLKSRRSVSGLWALPKKGATHVPFWVTRKASGATDLQLTLNLRLRAEAIGDLLQNFIGVGTPTLLAD